MIKNLLFLPQPVYYVIATIYELLLARKMSHLGRQSQHDTVVNMFCHFCFPCTHSPDKLKLYKLPFRVLLK